MRVDKVILRAAFSTLAAIFVLFAFMIFALNFLYPSTMMEITYDLGMDSASISCARRAYNRDPAVEYIAFATEVAIGLGDNEEIERCGDLFIDNEEFGEYCREKNESLTGLSSTYEQYVYGQVCVAKYRLGKVESALNRAFDSVGNAFPKNNAMVALLVTALGANDGEMVERIKLNFDRLTNLSADDAAYLDETSQNLLNE